MKKVLKYLVLSFLFVAGNVYASPANDMFIDDNLNKCVVDSYNGLKTYLDANLDQGDDSAESIANAVFELHKLVEHKMKAAKEEEKNNG